MNKNTETINKEFCEGKKLVFFPQSKEEAQFIQATFFEMGFEWAYGRGAKVNFVKGCVKSGLMLDTDGFLYTYDPQRTDLQQDALLCDSRQFAPNWEIADIRNRIQNLPPSKIYGLFAELQGKFPADFAAAAHPAALTRALKVRTSPLGMSGQKQPSQG